MKKNRRLNFLIFFILSLNLKISIAKENNSESDENKYFSSSTQDNQSSRSSSSSSPSMLSITRSCRGSQFEQEEQQIKMFNSSLQSALNQISNSNQSCREAVTQFSTLEPSRFNSTTPSQLTTEPRSEIQRCLKMNDMEKEIIIMKAAFEHRFNNPNFKITQQKSNDELSDEEKSQNESNLTYEKIETEKQIKSREIELAALKSFCDKSNSSAAATLVSQSFDQLNNVISKCDNEPSVQAAMLSKSSTVFALAGQLGFNDLVNINNVAKIISSFANYSRDRKISELSKKLQDSTDWIDIRCSAFDSSKHFCTLKYKLLNSQPQQNLPDNNLQKLQRCENYQSGFNSMVAIKRAVEGLNENSRGIETKINNIIDQVQKTMTLFESTAQALMPENLKNELQSLIVKTKNTNLPFKDRKEALVLLQNKMHDFLYEMTDRISKERNPSLTQSIALNLMRQDQSSGILSNLNGQLELESAMTSSASSQSANTALYATLNDQMANYTTIMKMKGLSDSIERIKNQIDKPNQTQQVKAGNIEQLKIVCTSYLMMNDQNSTERQSLFSVSDDGSSKIKANCSGVKINGQRFSDLLNLNFEQRTCDLLYSNALSL